MKFYILLFCLFVSLTACEKSSVQDSTARFMVVHASPETPDMELFIDDKPIIINPLTFTNNIFYREILSGIRRFKVVISGNPIIDTALNFERDKGYTIFVYDEPIEVKIKFEEEQIQPAQSGKCRIRFYQFVPDADSLDLVDLQSNAPIFTNTDFGKGQDWKVIDAGIYRFQLKNTANGTSIYNDWRNDTLEAGKVYTIFSKGFINTSTDDSLGVWLISNGEF